MAAVTWCEPCAQYERLCGSCKDHAAANECLELNCTEAANTCEICGRYDRGQLLGSVCRFCNPESHAEADREGLSSYDYRVEIVGLYWSLTTQLEVDLPDTVGNLSDEAREIVEAAADDNLRGELGISPLGFAHSSIVTLLLDGEEVQL